MQRGFRSHHILLGVNEAGLEFVSSTHPHGVAGLKAAKDEIEQDPTLHLKFARAFVDYFPGLGKHGQKKRLVGDGITHTTGELNSETADFQRVQELELTAQLADHPNLNVTRTSIGDLIITEDLAPQHHRKISITFSYGMLDPVGHMTSLIIDVATEINGQADPQQHSVLGVGLSYVPPNIDIHREGLNFSADEILPTVAAGLQIFETFAALDNPSRGKFANRLTDNLGPEATYYRQLDSHQAHLLRALSLHRFKLSHSGY